MLTVEETIEEAERLIALLDKETDEGPQVKVPSWLKINDKLQYYFDWKYTRWSGESGWYYGSDRVYIGGAAL